MLRPRVLLAASVLLGSSLLVVCCAVAPSIVPTTAPTRTAAATATNAPTVTPTPSATVDAGPPVTVVDGLAAPWSVAFTRAGAVLVSERDTARVLELLPAGGVREVARIDGVATGGEGGLLGLAVDSRDRLYVSSTAADGNRIQRYDLEGSAGALALGEPRTILEGLPRARFHNGGRIAFGPDGMLYATAGDATAPGIAQDLGSLGGKILRMTPDGAVPPDNPFAGSLVYSYGHRNPQGIAWAADGTMFASEFGQDTWDELNIIIAGGNYGWPIVEGAGGESQGFVDPVQQWRTDAASPSGIAIAGGTVFIANLRGEVLTAVPVADPSRTDARYDGEYGRLRDVAVAPDGRLFVLTNNTDGRGSPRSGDDRLLSLPVE